MVVGIRLVGVNEALTTGTTRDGNPLVRSAKAATRGGSHDLEQRASEVNQAQLDDL